MNVPLTVLNYPETSWAKFYQTYVVEKNKFYVFSYDSLTTNFGDAGEHFNHDSSAFQSVLFYGKKEYRMPAFEDGVKYDIFGEPLGLGKVLEVPEASEPYVLPQATADALGGVKANAKTEDDTVPARIDADGKLWVRRPVFTITAEIQGTAGANQAIEITVDKTYEETKTAYLAGYEIQLVFPNENNIVVPLAGTLGERFVFSGLVYSSSTLLVEDNYIVILGEDELLAMKMATRVPIIATIGDDDKLDIGTDVIHEACESGRPVFIIDSGVMLPVVAHGASAAYASIVVGSLKEGGVEDHPPEIISTTVGADNSTVSKIEMLASKDMVDGRLLPKASLADKGQIARVDSTGAWGKEALPKPVFLVTATVSGATATFDKTLAEISEAYSAGNVVQATIANGDRAGAVLDLAICVPSTLAMFSTTIDMNTSILHLQVGITAAGAGFYEKQLLTNAAENRLLPETSSADAGKILTVGTDGAYALTELPKYDGGVS